MNELKDDLFKAVQFCHDNYGAFIEEFMNGVNISELEGFYFSGSQCLVKYTCRHGDDCNCIIKTRDVFDWMIKKGFKL